MKRLFASLVMLCMLFSAQAFASTISQHSIGPMSYILQDSYEMELGENKNTHTYSSDTDWARYVISCSESATDYASTGAVLGTFIGLKRGIEGLDSYSGGMTEGVQLEVGDYPAIVYEFDMTLSGTEFHVYWFECLADGYSFDAMLYWRGEKSYDVGVEFANFLQTIEIDL